MKAFKVIFQHGHFIDTETGKRLIPVQGAEYYIIADSEAFKSEDVKLKFKEPLNAADKLAWAKSEFGKGNFIKILNAGSPLFFRIGNSKKWKGMKAGSISLLVQSLRTCICLKLSQGRVIKSMIGV